MSKENISTFKHKWPTCSADVSFVCRRHGFRERGCCCSRSFWFAHHVKLFLHSLISQLFHYLWLQLLIYLFFWKKIKCRFDKIINKEIPSKVVYEDDKVLPCSLTYVWFRIPEVHLWYRVAISILYGYKICYEMYKLLFFWTFFIYL